METKSSSKLKCCVRPALMSASQFPLTSTEAFLELRKRGISLSPVKRKSKPPTMKKFKECMTTSNHNNALQSMVTPCQTSLDFTEMAKLRSHDKTFGDQPLAKKMLCRPPDGKCGNLRRLSMQAPSSFSDQQMDATPSPEGTGHSEIPAQNFSPFKALHLNSTLLMSSPIPFGLKQLIHVAQLNASTSTELSLHESIARITDMFSASTPASRPAKPLENGEKSCEIGKKLSLEALQDMLENPAGFSSDECKADTEVLSCTCIRKGANQDMFKNERQADVGLQLAVAVYRFGTDGNGASVRNVVTKFAISEGAVEVFTRRKISALLHISVNCIQLPDEHEHHAISSSLEVKGFPGCVGCIDGTHIDFNEKPTDDGVVYFSRKKRYGLQLQIVADFNKRIHNAFTGYPASVHLATSFKHCHRKAARSRFQSLRNLRVRVTKACGHNMAVRWTICCILHNILQHLKDHADDEWMYMDDDENHNQQYIYVARLNDDGIRCKLVENIWAQQR